MKISVNDTTPFGELADWEACGICGGLGSYVYDGGCAECDPSIPLEYSPVRASFTVTDGAARALDALVRS